MGVRSTPNLALVELESPAEEAKLLVSPSLVSASIVL